MAYANFIPEVWSKKLLKNFDKTTVMANLINRDYEGEIKQAGDTVNIRSVGDVTVRDYVRDTAIVSETFNPSLEQLIIDQQKYFSFEADDLDVAQSDISILEKYSERAAVAIRNVVDSRLLSHHAQVNASNVIGSSGSPTAITPANFYGLLVDLETLLQTADTADGMINVVMSPKHLGILRKTTEFTRATSLGDKVVRNGFAGTVANLMVHQSTNLPVVGGATPILAFTKDFITYASQVAKTEKVRPTNKFSDLVKGLYLYGSKVCTQHNKCGAVLWTNIV